MNNLLESNNKMLRKSLAIAHDQTNFSCLHSSLDRFLVKALFVLDLVCVQSAIVHETNYRSVSYIQVQSPSIERETYDRHSYPYPYVVCTVKRPITNLSLENSPALALS